MRQECTGRRARVATALLLIAGLLVTLPTGDAGASDRFPDVPDGHPFHDDIGWMAETGITTGMADGSYHPTRSVSRQSMARFLRGLWEHFGEPISPPTDPGFVDVPDDHPFFDDIAWMAAVGITAGFPDGGFHPIDAVSRQSMAAFLHRFWGAIGQPDPATIPPPSFGDVPPDHPFLSDIAWMAAVGITSGFPDGSFRPGEAVSRQSMAAFLRRLWMATGIEVDHAGDSVDADPGDGICADADGHCTLRAAIDETNEHPGADRIRIRHGLHPTLALAGRDDDDNLTGDLDVSDDLTLVGREATIDANGLDRVIHAATDELTIAGVVITGGLVPESGVWSPDLGGGLLQSEAVGVVRVFDSSIVDNAALEGGGGIHAPRLVVTRSIISSNEAFVGAGIFVDAPDDEGLALDVVQSEISENVGDGGETGGASGGGIRVANGSARLTDSTVTDNQVLSTDLGGFGGGINARDDLILENTAVGGNRVDIGGNGGGGGIYVGGDLTMQGATVEDNTVESDDTASGGGVYVAGSATVGQSTIRGNSLSSSDSNAHGGGLFGVSETMVLDSVIDQNTATAITDDHAARGAGIYQQSNLTLQGADVTDNSGSGPVAEGGGVHTGTDSQVISTTIADNTVSASGAGEVANGGGIYISTTAGQGTISHSTISGNEASVTTFDGVPQGGGLYNRQTPYADDSLTITDTTVSGNRATGGFFPAGGGAQLSSGTALHAVTFSANTASIGGALRVIGSEVTVVGSVISGDGDDCAIGLFGTISSSDHNLVSDDSCGFDEPTDLVAADPLLGPLADNGGPTLSHRPLDGSPALDSVPLDAPTCSGTDQRGVPRPQGPLCDRGALER